MPPIPTQDWYLVVPISAEPDPRGFHGSAQMWTVPAASIDEAAQIAIDAGIGRCGIVRVEYHEGPPHEELVPELALLPLSEPS